jgi:hypothetical protein
LPKIKTGNQRLLRESFRTAHDGNLENAHTYLAFGSECPPNAADTYAMLLEHGIDTAKSFRVAGFMNGMADQAIEQALWTGSRRAQSPDAAALHARVLAEYLRYRLGRDGTYQPVLSDIFADKNGRSAAMDYMKRVQHALVDHVAINGKDLPLNRGAALLHELRDEIPGSDLWAHKIAEIGFRRFARANNFTLTFDKS